ncbi:unnamed protein product, partial [Soboliphyme baturini]|uniref:G_PROTEIN_RECEP_F1_2 domain-containing protein n=1 Tax=Soboliphyme baturini TaxID=241478 RepID=A0A183IA32_9BILA
MENASDAIRSLAVKVYDILAVNSSTVYPVVAYDHDNPSFVVSSLVCSILMIIVGTIGLFSNSFIIYVFSRTYPASSMNILIIGLAVADTVLVVSATPVYSLLALYADQPPQHVVIILNYLIVSLYPLSMMSQCASVWMLVVITAERFIAVCYPLAARRICTGRRAVMALLFVAVLSV